MKIWKKNFFYTIVIIMITMVLSLAFLYFVMPIYYHDKQMNETEQKIEELLKARSGKDIDQTINYLKKKKIENIQVEDNKDQVIYSALTEVFVSSNYKTDKYELQPSENFSGGIQPEDETKFEWQDISMEGPDTIRRRFKDVEGDTYYLSSHVFTQKIDEASGVLLDLAPVILIFSLLLGTVAALIYSKNSTKRIREISETTKKMVRREEKECQIIGNDEITSLAKDINHLNHSLINTIEVLETEVEKVEGMEQSKAYFVQSAAHELKTPITIMVGIVEGMRLNVGKYKDREKYLSICQELLKQQEELIQEISTVYKSELLTKKNNFTRFSLKAIVEELIAPYQIISETSKKYFSLQLDDSMITANEESIRRLLSNIITNAYQYSTEDGEIRIELKEKKVVVSNTCTPLSNKVLKKVFEPFYRPDYARKREDGGTGLGLFLVKQIAEEFGYGYRFESMKNNQGMVFTVELQERCEALFLTGPVRV